MLSTATWWFSNSVVPSTLISLHSRKPWVDYLPSLSFILLIYIMSIIRELIQGLILKMNMKAPRITFDN